jgi:hypothetical protein
MCEKRMRVPARGLCVYRGERPTAEATSAAEYGGGEHHRSAKGSFGAQGTQKSAEAESWRPSASDAPNIEPGGAEMALDGVEGQKTEKPAGSVGAGGVGNAAAPAEASQAPGKPCE